MLQSAKIIGGGAALGLSIYINPGNSTISVDINQIYSVVEFITSQCYSLVPYFTDINWGLPNVLSSNINVFIQHGYFYSDFCYNSQLKSISYLLSRFDNSTEITQLATIVHDHNNANNTSYNYALMSLYRFIVQILPFLIAWLGYASHLMDYVFKFFFYLLHLISKLTNEMLGSFVNFIIRLLELLINFVKHNKGVTLMFMSSNVNAFDARNVIRSGNTSVSNFHLRLIFTLLGLPLYILVNWLYDFLYRRSIGMNRNFLVNGSVNWPYIRYRLLLGTIFYVLIFIGVMFSTCFWFITVEDNHVYRVTGIFIAYLISYLANITWMYLARLSMLRPDVNNSIFAFLVDNLVINSLARAISEATAFTALSWATFAIWDFWVSLGISHLYPFLLALLLYIIIGILQVTLEQRYAYILLYGFVYNINFSLLSLSTNGLFFLISPSLTLWSNILLGIITWFIIILLPMEVYRSVNRTINVSNTHSQEWFRSLLEFFIRQLVGVIYLYVLFFCFASHTYIVYTYITFMH